MAEISCIIGGIEFTLNEGDPRVFIRKMTEFALEQGFPCRFVIPIGSFMGVVSLDFTQKKSQPPGDGDIVPLAQFQKTDIRDVACIACGYRNFHDLPETMTPAGFTCPGCRHSGCVVFMRL